MKLLHSDTGRYFKNETVLLLFLTLLVLGLRVLFLRFDNMPSDAAGHIESALRILDDPNLSVNYDGNCSTLHKYAIAPFLLLNHDPILGARIFTLFFGVFLTLPYYGTMRILFDRKVAFFSTVLLAFYPLHVVQSSTTTPDAVYYFVTWSFLYFFFKERTAGTCSSSLWFSCIFLNTATLLRFESWIFIPITFFLLWPRGLKRALLFLGFSMIGPFFCLLMNTIIHHDPLYSFSAAARTAFVEIVEKRIPSYDPRFWSWFQVLMSTAGPVLALCGIGGMILALASRRKWELTVFFGVLFFALTFNSYAVRMWHHERYSIPLALWLIPYAVFFFETLLNFLKLRKAIYIALLVLFPLLSFWRMPFRAIPHMLNFTPPEVNELGLWLRENMKGDENIIIDTDSFHVYTSNIMLRTGIPFRRCLTLKNPVFGKRFFESQNEFICYLNLKRPRYFVLSSDGQLQQKILKWNLEQKEIRLSHMLFERMLTKNLRQWGRYLIYKVSYGEGYVS